jgi:hypothetical protein
MYNGQEAHSAEEIRKSFMTIKRFLFACPWLVLALSTALLFFKTALTSDSLFLDNVAYDLFEKHGIWREWRFTAAPAYIPDFFLYMAAYKLLPQPMDRIIFVTVAQAFLVAASLMWLAQVTGVSSPTDFEGL